MDPACYAVLSRLMLGPADTIELQDEILTTHVAKPIFDLRKAGHDITTRRLANGVALYTLHPAVPVGAGVPEDRQPSRSAGAAPAPSRASVQFGDMATVYAAVRPKRRVRR